MAATKLKVTGLKELDRKFKELDRKMTGKALRDAGGKAMRPMKAAAKRNAQAIADSGATAAAMGEAKRNNTYSEGRRWSAGIWIGPKRRQKRALGIYNALREKRGQKPVEAMRHFHLAEFGRKRPFALGHRYMTRAFDTHAAKVPALLRKELAAILKKITR